MDIKFILIEPEDPRNVGSAARAINTMGHSSLVLVNPCSHLCGKARALAHGSHHILENAEVYQTFEEAAKSVDFLIATTARHRKLKMHYRDSREIPGIIENKKGMVDSVGIVFGPEKSGLKNDVLYRCDIVSSVATASPHPSINLAQSVMIFSYMLSQLSESTTQDWRIDERNATGDEYRVMREGAFELVDLLKMENDRHLKRHLRGAIARLGHDDLYLLHNLRRRISTRLKSLMAELNSG